MVSICIWWEILAVHKYALYASAKRYTIKFCVYILVASIGCFFAYYISSLIAVDGILGLLASGSASLLVYGLIILIIYGRTREFRALMSRFMRKR